MYKFHKLFYRWTAVGAVLLLTAAVSAGEPLGLGRAATAEDIAAWDIDVRYDGKGLPPGRGDVARGEVLFDSQCASCHGDFGQGEGRWPALTGGEDTLLHQGADGRPEKTVGSYWPFAPTLFDYIRRTMPYTAPQSLSDNDTYALVAYLLRLNDIVDDDFVADLHTLPKVQMPNRDNFFIDPRPDSSNIVCLENCADATTRRLIESITGVTPTQHLTAAQKPAISTAPTDHERGAAVYKASCAICHATGVADAPREDDTADWRQRLQAAGSEEALFATVITGKGAMPPRGGAPHLSDEEIIAAARYLLNLSGKSVIE